MKQLSVLALFVLAGNVCQAQTSDEWIRQTATQKKYLIQQIAALRVYLDYVQEGYVLVQKGLTAISGIKQGEFDLHRAFLGSQKSINPLIENYAKEADMIAHQQKVVQLSQAVRKQVRADNLFNAAEADYVSKVFEKVLDDCNELISGFTSVMTSHRLEMKDDERLQRIGALYSMMQEACAFAQDFASEIKLLCLQRMKEQADVRASRALTNSKNE
ncbi:hypothetical protein [Flavisolibacter nicotianae]|uniref:hypothetical protein n=1 Tax=Flavisolibacter nicotianae TaxID=2364882 RepID=UPI000EB43AE6|nr:hypothetical protein [Flavisolibacter nicotianae]